MPTSAARLYSEDLNRQQWHQPLLPGEIGCYASHLSAWRRLVDSGEPRLAVFEDDVDVDADLRETLTAIDRLPADWDTVKLVGRRRDIAKESAALLDGHDLVDYRRVPGLTSGYVVSRRGADKLLAHRLPFGHPDDVDLQHWWECDHRICGVAPYPVHPAPSSGKSTIGSRHPHATPRGVRLRKFLLQARYTLHNWRAAALRRRNAAPRRPRVGDPGRSAGPMTSGQRWRPDKQAVALQRAPCRRLRPLPRRIDRGGAVAAARATWSWCAPATVHCTANGCARTIATSTC